MSPDINSLTPSRSSISSSPAMTRAMATSEETATLRGQTPSPSPRSASTSLQAAATVNAGLQQEESRRSSSRSGPPARQISHSGRRLSAVLNIQLNDPTVPGPGEMIHEGQTTSYRTSSPQSFAGSPIIGSGDPHHNRTPSLGEIHQEIEQEQEAQVNRLLQMIRLQQQQLQALQSASGQSQSTPPAIDDSTPTSERSMSFPNILPHQPHSSISTPRSPTAIPQHPSRTSFDIARRSRTPSRHASPRLRSTSISGEGGSGDSWSLGGSGRERDETAFYQAETQMMIRENQMLRQRIAQLERQVQELNPNSAITHEPAIPSHLMRATSVSEEKSEVSETAGPAREAKTDE